MTLRICLLLSAWLLATGLAAQTLPPPVTGGLVDIEATVGAETRSVQHDYLPPKSATILAETLHRARTPKVTVTATESPATAGELTGIFNFDPNYAAGHPDVIRPIGGWSFDWDDWFYYAYYQYSKVTKKTTWDAQGQVTYSLQAKRLKKDSTYTIEGTGAGAAMMAVGAPSFWPTKFDSRDVTSFSGNIGRFQWGWPWDRAWRYLHGIQGYFYVPQVDGTNAVFHLNYFTGPFEGPRAYYPIGELTVAGTPGHGKGVSYQTSVEPLTEAGAYDALRGESWSFTGNFEPTPGAGAHYAFASDAASASKLQYKIVVQPGLARTVTWSETFTPEGTSEPSDIRFMSENVTAEATETPVHTIDPFARFGSQPGTYQVLAFEAESFEAGLTVDANRDGQILPAAGPMTPYVIANADLASTEKPYGFLINADDDDSDGVADNADLQINGPDDLADFFPVFLNIKQLLSTLPAGTKCILRQADGAVNFVYTDLKQATAFTYLNNPETGFGPNFDQPAATATAQQITSEGVELSEGFVNRIRYQNQGVILVEFRAPTQQPLTLTIETGTGVFVISLPLQTIQAELAVDANRDGTIKLASEDDSDATTADNPYRFWLNDDFDRYNGISPPADGAIPDYARETVGANSDDFKDFFPVFLDIKHLVNALPPESGSGVVYKLKQADGAVRFFYTSLTRATAFAYRNSPNLYWQSNIHLITQDGFILDREFLYRIRDEDQGVILMEGTKATTRPLALVVEKDGVTVAEVSLPLSIGQDIVLLLHGMNSSVHTWNEFVNRFFGNFNSANIVDGDFDRVLPPSRNRNGVRCYRLQFGAYEAQSMEGLQGVTAANTPNYLSDPLTKCGDFENFFTLGTEVSDAISLLTHSFPNARVLLVGHSRGGLAGRMFLQTYAQSEAAATVVGLLTTSSPHLGSRMGRIYEWLRTHPEGPQDDRALDWYTVHFLRNAPGGIDVRRPVIKDVADISEAIRELNHLDTVARLPVDTVAGGVRAQFGYSAIVYNKAKLGTLLGGEDYTLYSVLGPSLGIGLPALSDSASTYILGDQTTESLSGDGLVPKASQTFFQLSGFSGTAKPTLEVTDRQVVHIQAPKELDDLLTQLNAVVPGWFQYE